MFVFVVVNVFLALNAGLVHNAAIIQESCQEQSMQASEQSYREVETGCGSVVESSSKSVQQQSSSSSSSCSSGGSSSLSSYRSLIEQCKYFKHQEWYYKQLELYGNNCLQYIKPIFDNLNCNKPCFGDWQYMQYIEKLRAIYEILNSNGIFDISCDLKTKLQFIEQAKCQLREILSCIPKSCFLHKPLSYICSDSCDVNYFPFIYGLCNGLFESQYTFYSTSSSSTSVSSTSTRSVSSSSSSSSFDIGPYRSIIEQCKYFKHQEWYYKQLELYGSNCLQYIQPIFDNLNCNKPLPCFAEWKYTQHIEKLRAIYEILNGNGIFDISCDLKTKLQFIEQAKCQLREILSCIPKSCFLHKPLSYICSDSCDVNYFPFIYGLCNSLFESQYPFHSTSSSSTSVSSTSTRSVSASSSSSNFDIGPYRSILEQCKYFKHQEWYYKQLELYGSNCLQYIQPIFDNLNCDKPCFGDWKYMEYIEKLRAIYEILNGNGIFDISCDIQTKLQFIKQAKCQLREILSCIPKSCFLHKPLSYICDDSCDVNYFPFIYGLCNGLFESQYSFYSTSSSSSSSHSSTSSCGSCVQQTETCSSSSSCSSGTVVC